MADLHDERGRSRAAASSGLLLNYALASSAGSPQTEWSHHCSACGKCCNSPPELSVAELFRHQDTFFGCLTIRRLKRPPAAEHALRAAFDQLGANCWHRLPNAEADTDDVLLATRGFDLGLASSCPALGDDQRCSLHRQGKPAICRVVPLDALSPDRVQHLVLQSRRVEARYFGSDCIEPGARPGFEVVTRRLSVVDTDAQAALAERRRDLALDRRIWGDAVFPLLSSELFSSPAQLARLPAEGFMTLSLVPVLMVLARESKADRGRCVRYLEAQAALAERLLGDARKQGHGEVASVRQLVAFAHSNARLCLQLRK